MVVRNTYSFLVLSLCTLTLSCSKEKETTSKDTVSIIPNAIGTVNYSDLKIKSSSVGITNNPKYSLIETIDLGDITAEINFINEIETSTPLPINKTYHEGNNDKKASLNKSNNTIITPSTYYRFILFEVNPNSDTWSATWIISGSTTQNLTATKHETYKWYAASYNEEQALPSVGHDHTKLPIDSVASEFLSASGMMTTGDKYNYINFTFQRKTAALRFIIDARKLKSTIKEISLSPVDNTILKGGTFNQITNKVESLKNFTTSTLNNSKWKNYDSSTADSIKVASFHTLGTDDITNFEIQLDKLVLEDKSDILNPITRTYTNEKMTLPVTIKPTPGQRNTFTITLGNK